MVDNLGYTTDLRNIPVEVFFDMITNDIKKLINTYGHKNCGLMHEELCEKITKIIFTKKKVILSLMDKSGQDKLNSEWGSKKKGFLNKLFEEEEFINVCNPFKKIKHQDIYQLLSRHVNFCKEKDKRRLALGKNPEYSKCVEYNLWIETEKASFTHQYLKYVRNYKRPTVNEYFSTKKHPGGHNPLPTYRNSKLDCNKYNPPQKSNPQIPEAKAPTDKLQLPKEPNIISNSQGKDVKPKTFGDSTSAKTKPDGNMISKAKSSAIDSQLSSTSETQPDDIPTGQDTPVKPKASDSSVNRNAGKKEVTPIQTEQPTNSPVTAREVPPKTGNPPSPPKDATLTPPIQGVSPPNAIASLSSSLSTIPDTASSKTPDESPNTYSTETLPAPSIAASLPEAKPPDVITPPSVSAPQPPGTSASSSASTVTTTKAPLAAVTLSTVNTTGEPISSIKKTPSVSSSPGPQTGADASGPKAIAATTAIDPQQIVVPVPTSYSGNRDSGTKSSKAVSLKPKGTIQATDDPLSNHTQQNLVHSSRTHMTTPDINPQKTSDHTNQHIKPNAFPNQHTNGVISQTFNTIGASVNTPNVKTSTTSKDSNNVRNKENANSNIEPEGLPPLINIIPIILIILTSFTALFLLYKYTPFGFLLGRRRKRKKHDLKRIFEIPEKPTYESPNITMHEWEDPNLVGKAVENDVNIKLLKINRYKQEMQKKKKKNTKTLIEVHMEVLEEYKNDEWELHKGDFLEICLRGFINEENDDYSKLPNTELTEKSTKNDKIIEDIQKKEILWNNWIEKHRNVLEQWKKKEWFHILKNKWKKEQQIYKEKNNNLQKNISNEQDTHSIVSQKETWKQWILKQATLIDMFNKEDWFKSIIYAQDKEKDNNRINEFNNISVTSKTELKNEKTNEEGRSKNIIQKLMVQIHMMVLEECIKEDIIRNKESSIDNFIQDIHKQNNYDEERNMPQCDTDNFKNTKPDFPCTHARKCAKIYEENIVNCSIFEDEFCKKLKAFRGILINHLVSLCICKNAQDIILSVDNKTAESTSKNQREESAQATTISVSSLGTMMGVSLLSLFLYKVTPPGSWLTPRIGNLKKTLDIVDNDKN
ncbi:STP1 protein [Plasmodium ovale wallikeri]|uniref:STP1 protein n=1 Tax=Plasmodium ovale wallikeri TaxID=864142 RepID=A0A1A9ANU3_PLAOA|nr:STP1 protein [Plasmodium ovale wallikeri]